MNFYFLLFAKIVWRLWVEKGFCLKDSSKKHASPLPFCRGGLGEAPYNTPRQSLLKLFNFKRELRPLWPATHSKSHMNYHKSTAPCTHFCRLVWQNKAFLLKNRFRSYLLGFWRRQTTTHLGKKKSEKRYPCRNIAPQRKRNESHQTLQFPIVLRFEIRTSKFEILSKAILHLVFFVLALGRQPIIKKPRK